MIRIVDLDSRLRHARSLEQHFRLRHEIFIHEKGWKEFDRGTFESDSYDDDNATYMLQLDRNEDVIGCFRLYPSTLPHMLSDHFAWMVDGAVPCRADILEATRFAIKKDRRNSFTYHELFLGMIEYGLQGGIGGITAVMRTLRIPILQSIGMRVRPLGLPHDVDGESHCAVLYEVSDEVLAALRKSAGVHDSVLESAAAASRVA